MAEVMNRLRRDKLPAEEFKYVSDLMSYEILMARKDQDFKDAFNRQRINFEYELKSSEQEKVKAEQDKAKAEQDKAKAEQDKIKLIKSFLQQGSTLQMVSETLGISVEQVKELIGQI
jgi:uncharacterized protein (DUF3084 family)